MFNRSSTEARMRTSYNLETKAFNIDAEIKRVLKLYAEAILEEYDTNFTHYVRVKLNTLFFETLSEYLRTEIEKITSGFGSVVSLSFDPVDIEGSPTSAWVVQEEGVKITLDDNTEIHIPLRNKTIELRRLQLLEELKKFNFSGIGNQEEQAPWEGNTDILANQNGICTEQIVDELALSVLTGAMYSNSKKLTNKDNLTFEVVKQCLNESYFKTIFQIAKKSEETDIFQLELIKLPESLSILNRNRTLVQNGNLLHRISIKAINWDN